MQRYTTRLALLAALALSLSLAWPASAHDGDCHGAPDGSWLCGNNYTHGTIPGTPEWLVIWAPYLAGTAPRGASAPAVAVVAAPVPAPVAPSASRPSTGGRVPASDCGDAVTIAQQYPVVMGMPLIEFLTGVLSVVQGGGTTVQVVGWSGTRAAPGCNVSFTYLEGGQRVELRYFLDGRDGALTPRDDRTRQTSGF